MVGSIPKLDGAIPAASGNFTGFDWMPFYIDTYISFVMNIDGSVVLTCLPIPKP